ncbi:MAG: hypothetical protein K6T63_11455 [Alicyclobacillus herbarius]|uniref:hypothetical protein n=1 Tax=Alicyclobacillus herbarius TaxID=122960 RepID=UPI0023579B3E|nr:hypothetical protein [Alicyclobacillus herbarius]MCL6633233.1 hypothetical protein [Alicyclobacillus herbarius]
MEFKPEWSISDIVNGVVALGTLAMAWYSRRMIGESRKSIQASERSARATEESVERMKDELMPYLALDIKEATGGFVLFVRNVGAGLARIRLATVRTDVKVESVLDEPISYWECRSGNPNLTRGKVRLVDFVIAAGDEYSFHLACSQQFNPDGQHNYLSSLSLFYEDVYKRLYRSRLLYQYKSWNGSYVIRSVATEQFRVDALPVSPISSFNIDRLLAPEGYIPHIYRPPYGIFTLVENRERWIGSCVAGSPFTQGKDVQIENIVIPWHGYPEFHLRIGQNPPFALVAIPIDGMGQFKYDIQNVPKNVDSWRGLQTPNGTLPFSEYGLVAEGRDEPNIKELYDRICKVLMDRVSPESAV